MYMAKRGRPQKNNPNNDVYYYKSMGVALNKSQADLVNDLRRDDQALLIKGTSERGVDYYGVRKILTDGTVTYLRFVQKRTVEWLIYKKVLKDQAGQIILTESLF